MKAYFLMRRDITMSQAKFAVQIGHGVELLMKKSRDAILQEWHKNDSTKIVLTVNTQESLDSIEEILVHTGIPHSRIYDVGRTEFEGKTYTGIVVFPLREENTPKKIKRLRLWTD